MYWPRQYSRWQLQWIGEDLYGSLISKKSRAQSLLRQSFFSDCVCGGKGVMTDCVNNKKKSLQIFDRGWDCVNTTVRMHHLNTDKAYREKANGELYKNITGYILNKFWKQHLRKQQPSISKTIQVRRTRYEGHCLRSKDELISDVLMWTLSHGRVSVGWSVRTFLQQLVADTGCNLEDLLETMDERDGGWLDDDYEDEE